MRALILTLSLFLSGTFVFPLCFIKGQLLKSPLAMRAHTHTHIGTCTKLCNLFSCHLRAPFQSRLHGDSKLFCVTVCVLVGSASAVCVFTSNPASSL